MKPNKISLSYFGDKSIAKTYDGLALGYQS